MLRIGNLRSLNEHQVLKIEVRIHTTLFGTVTVNLIVRVCYIYNYKDELPPNWETQCDPCMQ